MFSESVILSLNKPVVALLREISRLRGSVSKSHDEKMKTELKLHKDNIDNLYEELKNSAEKQNIPFEKY
jgi:hypothetical protein